MTEKEWLAATDPTPMLEYLRESVSDRKFKLVACGCGRLVNHLVTDPRSKAALSAAERGADSFASLMEIDAALRSACEAAGEINRATLDTTDVALLATRNAVSVAAKAIIVASHLRGVEDAFFGAVDGVKFAQSALGYTLTPLLRDIFGNPFRPVILNPDWLTPTVTSLAQAVYADRLMPSGLFDNLRMGLLADALEEAGCHNADILGHLRGGGEHVRGCFAVDLVLGKE
jgi:hypothetical protein